MKFTAKKQCESIEENADEHEHAKNHDEHEHGNGNGNGSVLKDPDGYEYREVIGDSEVKSVFIPIPKAPFYREIFIKGKWETDDDAILDIYDAFDNHLEISTKSNPIGQALSAMNLSLRIGDKEYCLESVYQASKVFRTGRYAELLYLPGKEAKKDPRLYNSGEIIGFDFCGKKYPVFGFYDWLYCKAVFEKDLEKNMIYDSYSDVFYSSRDSTTGFCQAKTAAILTGLISAGHDNMEKETNNLDYESFITLMKGG